MKTFNLGYTCVTPSAQQSFSNEFITTCFTRHANCDFGNLCSDDIDVNIEAIESNDQIMSSYKDSNNNTLWIITDAGHCVTTALRPSDY